MILLFKIVFNIILTLNPPPRRLHHTKQWGRQGGGTDLMNNEESQYDNNSFNE